MNTSKNNSVLKSPSQEAIVVEFSERSNNPNKLTGTPKIINETAPELLTGLVHEIRNPLNNINLSVEMMQPSLKDDKELKLFLEIILRNSLRIEKLVNDLLNNSLPKSQPAKYSIHDILDEVISLAEDRITLRKINVVKDYSKTDCKVIVNPVNMKIAVTNILINAIDAMAIGKGQLKVVTRTLNGKHKLDIIDNGCGISKEDLENIFTPFFTNKPGGMGIGLSITHQILSTNQVEMQVRSEKGKGTCFSLLFEKECID